MAIKIFLPALLLVVLVSCKKKVDDCYLNNMRYLNDKGFFVLENELDSFSQGYKLAFKIELPKKYFDYARNVSASYDNTEIICNLIINDLRNNNLEGAIEHFDFELMKGKMYKDSSGNYSENQLKTLRTFVAVGNVTDTMLTLRFNMNLKTKGVYSLYFTPFAGKATDCATHKYTIRPKVNNKNLNYISQLNNGYVDDFTNQYVYCFKVY
jgi:hypothetical protein